MGGSSSWSNITSLEYKEMDSKQKIHSSIFPPDCMKSKNLKSRHRHSLDVLSREFSKILVHTKQRSIPIIRYVHQELMCLHTRRVIVIIVKYRQKVSIKLITQLMQKTRYFKKFSRCGLS